MKKVYLIYEICSSWEDCRELLVDSRFDKDESDEVLKKLKKEVEDKTQSLFGLEVHVDNCNEDECSKCAKYFELGLDIRAVEGYLQKEIEVLEKGENS